MFVAIEGPIGVGKTTLAKLLTTTLQSQNIQTALNLEMVEENPFLPEFYKDPSRHAFAVQVFFLLSRYRQLQHLSQEQLFVQHMVSDYTFRKDFVFASMNLSDAEFALYQELYAQLQPRLRQPDLIVYLEAQPKLLLERIGIRGREFEQNMQATYLEKLNWHYEKYFETHTGPVLRLNAHNLDFVSSTQDAEAVVQKILEQIHLVGEAECTSQ